ncbi:DUF423 domain-containing protein [Nannocystaceae bacterium ST9]
MTQARLGLILAGVFGLIGVATGALGAHALAERIAAEQLEWWNTAARYQQIHAVALLATAGLAGPWSRARKLAVPLFAIGMVIFSGTLFSMALGAPRWFGAITPLGGLALMGGWLALIGHGMSLGRSEPAR